MPRPWLLAAMTGVPIEALLRRAEQEEAERGERLRPLPEHHFGPPTADQAGTRPLHGDMVRLPS